MILVLNCGSQSIKWKVFGENLEVVKEGKVSVSVQENFEDVLRQELVKINPSDRRTGRTQIKLIGHRVVHGGRTFVKPIKITNENLTELEKINYLAPLHNPFSILGIKVCQTVFSGIQQIAVFDTEFFKDLPEKAFSYALPEEITKKSGYRRFGFHGISHEYVAKEAQEKFKNYKNLKIITCHLGGGASITAIKNGKAIDTSMGFTPMQGLVMMTRAGDIDSGVVLELVRDFGLDKTKEILNKDSGIRGICGEDSMLEVLRIINDKKTGNSEQQRKAKLALDIFVYSIRKYIGSYFAILGGCDVLVFTGAIGEGSKKIRDMICKDLKILVRTKVIAIETDEELAIAQKL